MRIKSLVPLLFFAFCLLARTGGQAQNSSKAVFSYLLDGKKISGGEVDELMINNAAVLTGTPLKLIFFLSDDYNEKTENFAHSLRFSISGKTGTTAFEADNDNWKVELFFARPDGKYLLYGNGHFSVTVTSISGGRATGTFSGKFKLVPETGSGQNERTITDGQFDIPLKKTP